MATTQGIDYRIAVEGSRQAVTDLAAVDAELRRAGTGADRASAAFGRLSRFASTSHVTRLAETFRETGVQVNFASRHIDDLASRMQRVARENAFRRLASDANLSAMQMARLRAGMGDYGGAFRSLGQASLAAKAGIAGVVLSLAGFQKAALESYMAMERTKQAYGTIFGAGADSQLQMVYEQSKRVGQEFMSSAEAAKTFFAAARDSGLSADMNRIYQSVSNAGAAMQLSGDQMQGVFLALGQMVSKGKVQAEELRGQLGERLPGAFQLAARAMNMTTAELDKCMADGKLMADDLLPRLADVLQEKFAGAAEKAADTVQGRLNNLLTEWERFKQNLAASGPAMFVMKIVTEGLEGYNKGVDAASQRAAALKSLKARGIAPAGTHTDISVTGQETSIAVFTEEQIRHESEFLKSLDAAWKAHTETVEASVRAEEKALSDRRKAINDARTGLDKIWGRTETGRLEKLKQQRQSLKDGLASLGLEATQEDIRKTNDAIADLDRQIANFGKKGGKGGKGLANRQFRWDTGLEQLRQEVANMESTLDPAAQGIEKLRQKLTLEKQNAIAAAEAHAKLSIQRKEATAAEAEERKGLEIRKAEITYAQKLAEVEARSRETRVSFYKEFSELSGSYTESLRLQAEAIRLQGQEYRNAGITEELVRQWETLKQMENARDPLSGMVRGLMKYSDEATNLASQMESAVTNAFTGMEDAFLNFVQTGKLSFTDLANSIITDLMRIAIRAAVLGPLTQGIGSLFSRFIGGDATTYSGSVSFGGGAAASGGANMSGLVGVSLHAKGDVFSGGSLHDYSNSIVTRPTLFSYGSHLTAYAQGAALMGEDGAEAILPLARTSRGDLGVQVADRSSRDAARDGGPHVTIVINNQTGANVEAQGEMKDDGNGNFNFEILLTQVQQGIVSQAKAGRSPLMNYVDQTRGLSRAGVLQKGRR